MFLRILTVLTLIALPGSGYADILTTPEKTLRYEVSNELGGQRKTVFEHRQERRELFAERQVSVEKKEEIRRKIEERFGHLSPEEKQAKLEELHQYRQMLHAELEKLPPEERMERMQELRAAYEKQGLAAFDEIMEEEPDVEPAE